jgi:hypothetical protein
MSPSHRIENMDRFTDQCSVYEGKELQERGSQKIKMHH